MDIGLAIDSAPLPLKRKIQPRSRTKVSRDEGSSLPRPPHNISVLLAWWEKRQSQGRGYLWSMAVVVLAGMSQPQARGAACVRIPTPACQLSDIHCFAVHCKGITPTSAHHNADRPNNVTSSCLLPRILYTVSSGVCGSSTGNIFPSPPESRKAPVF